MKMRLLVTLSLLFAVTLSQAQQAVGTPAEIKRFLGTTTYVVLESNYLMQYNNIIKETVEKHWDLTPYEFVTYSSEEWEKVRTDTTKSFLMQYTVFYDRDKTKAKYNFLSLQLGGDAKLSRDMAEIASFPISYEGVDEDSYDYKLGMMCRFLQNHVKMCQEHPEITSKNVLKFYYKNLTGDVKNKTLYVTESDFAKNFKFSDVKAMYPGEIELVSREKIEEAIDQHDENVVFIHKVGPESRRKARCYKTIVGAADAKLYYFSWHMIDEKNPDGMLKKDWKKLAKAKQK